MKWISLLEEEKWPCNPYKKVLVTDGHLVSIASYIQDPKNYYKNERGHLWEWDSSLEGYVVLEKRWHDPHWKIETCIVPFTWEDESSGVMEDITHWMPLPLPPKGS